MVMRLQVIRERLEKDPKSLTRLRLLKKKTHNKSDKNAKSISLPESEDVQQQRQVCGCVCVCVCVCVCLCVCAFLCVCA